MLALQRRSRSWARCQRHRTSNDVQRCSEGALQHSRIKLSSPVHPQQPTRNFSSQMQWQVGLVLPAFCTRSGTVCEVIAMAPKDV